VHEASICVSIRFLSPAGAYGVIERHQLYRRFATNVNRMAIITIVVFPARGCSEGSGIPPRRAIRAAVISIWAKPRDNSGGLGGAAALSAYNIQRYAATPRRANKNPVKTKTNPNRSVSSGTTFAISFSLSLSSLVSSLSAIC
jgi:hypothetical protein